MDNPSLGEIVLFAGNFAPRGWAFCNGQLLPISGNGALFALLGTTYGGDGTTNFALPDLRRRAPVCVGTGPGLSPYALGSITGTETETLTAAQIPSHAHNLQASSNPPTQNAAAGASLASGDRVTPMNNIYTTGNTNVSMTPTTGNAGGNSSHNNMQPYLTLNYIIAITGVVPV